MEISKFRSQPPTSGERIDRLRNVEERPTKWASTVADTFSRWQATLRTSGGELRKPVQSSRPQSTAAGQIAQFRFRFQTAARQKWRRLGGALRKLKLTVEYEFSGLREAFRAKKTELFKSLRSPWPGFASVSSGQIARCRTVLRAPFGLAVLGISRGWNGMARLGKRVADQPRVRREALRATENELHKLLESSLDAILVTNGSRRFLAANPKALDLFGISGANLTSFTVDVFLSRGQVQELEKKASISLERQQRQGKCKIRRLDGSLRIAQYALIPNFLPLMDLYKFSEVTQKRRIQLFSNFKPSSAIIKYRPASYFPSQKA